MKYLEGLEPKKVFEYFEYISSVPRGSGNTKAVSDLCVKFANERGLDVYQDSLNNVIIRKPATPGYEDAPIVILQGHLDMVCAKTDTCSKDMATEPIDLTHDDKYVFAKDTTLGGDDGIAVAYALAILDSSDIKHPAIEAVFTVDEETGMDGASGIDANEIKGRILLNIDSEEEGIFTCGCAGGCRVNGEIPVFFKKPQRNGGYYKITLSGLKGGHSGTEIHKQPASANFLMGRVLYELYYKSEFNLVYLKGGKFDNVISSTAEAVIFYEDYIKIPIDEVIGKIEAELKTEYGYINPELKLKCEETEPISLDISYDVLDKKSTENVIHVIYLSHQGVIETDPELKGMIRTSQNLGIIDLQEDKFCISFLVRSSINAQKESAVNKISQLVHLFSGSVSYTGNYPGWKYEPVSRLKDVCIDVYKEQYGKEPVVTTIHAGLECGLFTDKLSGLDAISIGPDILAIHTPNEKLDIASVGRVWKFLLTVLEKMK